MNISLGRALSTLAITAGLALSTAGAASAANLAVDDARGDVLAYDGSSETEADGTPAPGVRNGDVLRTTFQHRDRRIAIRMKYADLRRRGDVFAHEMRIVTNDSKRWDVVVYAAPQMWRGQAEMARGNGNPVECKIAHRIDYDTDVLVVSFPRTCVGKPRWVRIGAGGWWMDGSQFYMDDAQRPGRVFENLRLSTRIRRG